MEILVPVLTLGVLGLIFGIGLAIASKRLAVKVDPRLEKIHGFLPGSNCGACGGAGCFGFAQNLLSGKMNVAACRISEETVKEQIARLLGKKLDKAVKKTAILHCNGGSRVKERFNYQGIRDCVAANLVLGGAKECVFGCLGFGDCVKVCPFKVIKMTSEGLPAVDAEKCKACNKCVAVCPKKLFKLIPIAGKVYIACSSHDNPKQTKSVCPVGCIACGLCKKACRFQAIDIIDNLAVIDYNKCTSCMECVKVCLVKCIKVKGN